MCCQSYIGKPFPRCGRSDSAAHKSLCNQMSVAMLCVQSVVQPGELPTFQPVSQSIQPTQPCSQSKGAAAAAGGEALLFFGPRQASGDLQGPPKTASELPGPLETSSTSSSCSFVSFRNAWGHCLTLHLLLIPLLPPVPLLHPRSPKACGGPWKSPEVPRGLRRLAEAQT